MSIWVFCGSDFAEIYVSFPFSLIINMAQSRITWGGTPDEGLSLSVDLHWDCMPTLGSLYWNVYTGMSTLEWLHWDIYISMSALGSSTLGCLHWDVYIRMCTLGCLLRGVYPGMSTLGLFTLRCLHWDAYIGMSALGWPLGASLRYYPDHANWGGQPTHVGQHHSLERRSWIV